jgi:hypothetical protein
MFVAEFVETMNRISRHTGDDHVVEVLGRRLPIGAGQRRDHDQPERPRPRR